MAHSINKYLISKGYIVNLIIYDRICSDTPYEGVNIINSNDIEKVNLAINSSSILFSQNLGYPELAVKKANELNKPVVIFLHTHGSTWDRSPEEYRGLIDHSKINVVYNSIWLKKFFNSSLNSIVLNPPINCADYNTSTNNMYVSLLNKEDYKGGDVVLRIAEKMPDVKFLIIGANEETIVNNITYKPNTKNVKEIYSITDIVLMPSTSESWGMVATEAMCSGIPTIASPTEGLKENLGYAGIFIDRNSIDEWVSMIYKLKNDRTFYNDISNKCKKRVQELDSSVQLEKFEQFINNILSK
jgi:glycosyltransferase involved in cell wall biosynthesis